MYNVLNYIHSTPNIIRPYKATEEIIDLSTMAMEYFKDHLEPLMPRIGVLRKDSLGKDAILRKSSSSVRFERKEAHPIIIKCVVCFIIYRCYGQNEKLLYI